MDVSLSNSSYRTGTTEKERYGRKEGGRAGKRTHLGVCSEGGPVALVSRNDGEIQCPDENQD